jgi:hypothetical protein
MTFNFRKMHGLKVFEDKGRTWRDDKGFKKWTGKDTLNTKTWTS